MSAAPLELVVGRVARSHGLAGELVVEVRTDEPELRFAPGSTLLLRRPKSASPAQALEVASVREHSSRLLVSFVGVVDRAAADLLRGSLLLVRSDELPQSDDPDEFYDHELVGLRVKDRSTGDDLGEVGEVAHSPVGDWLLMRTEEGHEVLIPFVAAIVVEVSRADKTVWVQVPEGLLELS